MLQTKDQVADIDGDATGCGCRMLLLQVVWQMGETLIDTNEMDWQKSIGLRLCRSQVLRHLHLHLHHLLSP